jgi:ribosomal protein L37AE/L43A
LEKTEKPKFKCKHCGCTEQKGSKANIWCVNCGNEMIYGSVGFERVKQWTYK